MGAADTQLLVVGGGVSGIGVALAARARGISVLVLERDRALSATSANSLRIIHGGFRYLQTLDLARALRSLRDQRRLLESFPDSIVPLPCLMPLADGGLRSARPLQLAQRVYRLFGTVTGAGRPEGRVLTPFKVQREFDELSGQLPNGAFLWYDALIADLDRFHASLLDHAFASGVLLREHCAVHAIRPQGSGFAVTLNSGETLVAPAVVNAAGPWINQGMSKNFVALPDLAGMQWARAFNVVVRRQLHPRVAVAGNGDGGRMLFAVPRGSGTALGTWYEPSRFEHHEEACVPSEQGLRALLSAARVAYPHWQIDEGDIEQIDCGLLPMRAMRRGEPVLYGSERIAQRGGYVELLSTKYTTFLSQGERVMRALRPVFS